MNIPPKYEDVVARLDAALGREAELCKWQAEQSDKMAALREELEHEKSNLRAFTHLAAVRLEMYETSQQRLTVAEQRAGELHKWVIKYRNVVATRRYSDNDEGDMHQRADRIELSRLDAALKPASEPTIEVARQSLSFENQRIQPARFHCLACGEYHEGSGNLPCPKMKPMPGVKP